jgi:hypothetical protein
MCSKAPTSVPMTTQSGQFYESEIKSDLKVIDNVIQNMPTWDRKYELGNIYEQERVSETQLFKNMRKVSVIIRRLNKYKNERNEKPLDARITSGLDMSRLNKHNMERIAEHSKYIEIIRPKIFQLYDMLISAPSDIKVSNSSPSLENIVTQHLTGKNQIPDVLMNIINQSMDPFDLVLYNQGDSKLRFKIAENYFKNNNMNSDFILSLSLDISSNVENIGKMDLLTYYLGFNSNNSTVRDRERFSYPTLTNKL